MSEENHEIINKEVENNIAEEENLEDAKEEIKEEIKVEEKINKEERKVPFNDSFMASLIDTVVITGISLVGLLIFDSVILKILGYKVIAEYKGTVLLFIFATVTLLYPAIMESKNGNTIGKKSSKLIVKKVEK